MDNIVCVHNLSYFFGTNLILKDVSVQIGAGKIILVIGKNGAGKSTFLKLIAGLLSVEIGKIELGITTDELAYLGHGTALYEQMSAFDNLNFWNKLYAKRQSSIYLQTLLGKVGLEKFVHEKVKTFSRGMSQRLSLARMLLLAPKLFLFDEPTTGLDLNSRAILLHEIKAAKARNSTVIWVSHDIANDVKFADHILLFDNKKLNYFENPTQIPAEFLC